MTTRLALWIIMFLLIIVAVPFVGYLLNSILNVDVSGWIQAGIALVSFPIILYEIDQIRRAVSRKPLLTVGLVNMTALPFSQIKANDLLPTSVKVSRGYAHFYLIVQNRGGVAARGVKIYLEHQVYEPSDTWPNPFVEVSEFSEGKYSFYAEHNFDFVFRSGIEWQIYPQDFESFGFHITTRVGTKETYTDKNGQTQHIMEFPSPCKLSFRCTLWAEGLEQPIRESLTVTVIDALEKDTNGNQQP